MKLLNTPVGGGGAKKEFLERIQHALDSRFSEFLNNGARDILLLTRIADIKSWPLGKRKNSEVLNRMIKIWLQLFAAF